MVHPRAIPTRSNEIFRQWLVEARIAKFNRYDYAAAFEDFWSTLARGDVFLHGLLCDWTRMLREENRARPAPRAPPQQPSAEAAE